MGRLVLGLGAAAVLLAVAGYLWRSLTGLTSTQQSGTGGSLPSPRDAELALEKQRLVWDGEPVSFEFETRFGREFVAALQTKDESRLDEFFHPDFDGLVLDRSERQERSKGILSEVRLEAARSGTKRAAATDLVRGLLRPLQEFESVERIGVRVLRITPADRASAHWVATVLLSAFGGGTESGLIELESLHQVEFVCASDGQLEPRQILTKWEMASEVLRTSRGPLMQEVTEPVGLASIPLPDNWKLRSADVRQYRFQIAAEDFDRDGYPDIAVATIPGRPMLLRSVQGRYFEDVAPTMRLASWQRTGGWMSCLAAWIDYDNDGFPDLLMGDRLYHNVQGKRFDDVTGASGLKIGHEPMGCAVADYDCDGRLDLYILYQSPEPGSLTAKPQKPWIGDNSTGVANRLWHNEGDGRFRDVTAKTGAGGGPRLSFAAAWFFYDDDRFPDLYIANDFGENVVLRNNGNGRFEDISESTGATAYATAMGVATGDLDDDGSPEIYVANMYSKMGRRILAHLSESDYPPGIFDKIRGSCAGNTLYRKPPGEGRYTELSRDLGINAVGWAYAPAMTDLDGDGRLDLYATAGFLSFERGKPDG